MAAPQDKRRQLDDEMSRFEAEILSGPLVPSSDSLNEDSTAELRPIIGSSTFDQVKQQLKQATSDDIQSGDHVEKPRLPPPPPGPPQLTSPSPSIRPPQQSGPNQPSSGIRPPLSGPRHPLSGQGGQGSPAQFGPGPQRYPQSQGSFGPPVNNRNSSSDQYGPGPNLPGPPEHYGQGPSAQFGPGPYGPGPNRPGPPGPFGQGPNRIGPPGFGPGGPGPNRLGPPGIGPFGPGQNRPGHPGPGPFGPGPNQPGPPGSNSFCPQMDPLSNTGPYSQHPSNHGFMGPRGRNGPPGMAPPPGFIPPQVNRLTNNGPMMMGPGPHGRPRPPASFLPPPPPPPGYMPQSGSQRMSIGPPIRTGNSSVISKPPTVISSAPMLYTDASKEQEKDDKQNKKSVLVSPTEVIKKPESRKKKKGAEDKKISNKAQTDTSIALEMADRVKQSMVTIKHSVNTHAQPQTHTEEKKKERKHKKNLRYAGGQVWEDQNLAEWDSDDFRLFVGDLGNDVTDDLLHRQFCHYASFQRAKVIRDKRTNKSKGYGFISFNDPQDYIRAMKEMNGKYLGSRPIKLRKSTWKDRNLDIVQKKLKEKQLAGLK